MRLDSDQPSKNRLVQSIIIRFSEIKSHINYFRLDPLVCIISRLITLHSLVSEFSFYILFLFLFANFHSHTGFLSVCLSLCVLVDSAFLWKLYDCHLLAGFFLCSIQFLLSFTLKLGSWFRAKIRCCADLLFYRFLPFPLSFFFISISNVTFFLGCNSLTNPTRQGLEYWARLKEEHKETLSNGVPGTNQRATIQ